MRSRRGKKLIPVSDVLEWAKWFENANRTVKQETLPNGLFVSTVFLGIGHILFETAVFRSRKGLATLDIERYSTWEEAERGHKAMVKKWKKLGGFGLKQKRAKGKLKKMKVSGR
jgi:hypothetical protein